MRPGKNLVLGIPLMIIVFALSAGALYGLAQLVDSEAQASADGNGGEDGGVPGGPVNVTVVAKELKFDKRTINASPGASVTVTLDNQDAGVSHNIAFYTNNRATEVIAQGRLFAGPGTDIASFTAPARPANYFFRCDAHPDTMTGTFSVR